MSEHATNGYAPSFQLVENQETSGPGRIPLDHPVYNMPDPTEQDEYARTTTEIMENFRFFGILMKKEESGGYRRIETIQRRNAKCIEEIKAQYGPGTYQLRFNQDEGEQERIDFLIAEDKKDVADTQPRNPALDEQYLSGLRHDLKEEIRSDYEADIRRLQGRVTLKDDELDDKSRKIRELHEEIGLLRSQIADQVKREIQPLQQKADQLENEKWELKDRIRTLELDLRLSETDEAPQSTGERILGYIEDHPELVEQIGPVLIGLLPGSGKAAQQLPQLQQHSPDQSQTQESAQQETERELTPEEVNQVLQKFADNIDKVITQFSEKNITPSAIKKFIDEQLAQLRGMRIEVPAQVWVAITRRLIQVSSQKGIKAARVAQAIEPILSQFKQAKVVLKTVDPTTAANLLINMYGIELPPDEKDFLIAVLGYFKKKVA